MPAIAPPERLVNRCSRPIAAIFGCAPTVLTLTNAACGVGAVAVIVVSTMAGNDSDGWVRAAGIRDATLVAAVLIGVGLVCDAVDGPLARFTGRSSQRGAQLDAGADFITFVVAPSVLYSASVSADHGATTGSAGSQPGLALLAGLFYVGCGGYRLCRFLGERQRSCANARFFSGLPTPAAAILLTALCLNRGPLLTTGLTVGPINAVILAAVVILGCLMVSRVPYPHLADWLRPRPAALAGLLLLAVVLAVAFGPRLMFVFVALGYVICGLLCEVSFRRRLQTH